MPPTAPQQPQPPSHDHLLHAILRELHGISCLLDTGDQVTDFNPSSVAVSDTQRAVREQRDWPITGGRRFVVPRAGFGGAFPLPAGPVITPILSADIARLGMRLSVPGALADVILYLADATVVAAGEAVPQVRLVAGGAGWDGKLGDMAWCGSICAQPATAAVSTLYVAVV